MKKFTITNAQQATDIGNKENPQLANFEIEGGEEMDASDGYHTFTELYEHRITLYMGFCKSLKGQLGDWRSVWMSSRHSDGSSFEGWFILGIGKEKGHQITYHLPNDYWGECALFAEKLDKAPEFDGHTSQDVLERIKSL